MNVEMKCGNCGELIRVSPGENRGSVIGLTLDEEHVCFPDDIKKRYIVVLDSNEKLVVMDTECKTYPGFMCGQEVDITAPWVVCSWNVPICGRNVVAFRKAEELVSKLNGEYES